MVNVLGGETILAVIAYLVGTNAETPMALSILSVINFVIPKDRGSRRVAHDVPYGPVARQHLDIYAPREPGCYPVVMFIYGGSWADGSRSAYSFVGRALAAQGFVTVIADYRLLPEVEYPDFLSDCALAVEWVAGNISGFGGDPQRMALMGHSAGAYNAAMLALDPRYLADQGLLDRVKCVVGLSGPYDFFPFDGPITLRTFGAVADPQSTQPVNHIGEHSPPMFLATGDKDTLVYPRNTVALATRLRDAGVAVEERHYAELGHPGTLMTLSLLLRNRAPVFADVVAFLKAQLGPVS